MDSRRDQVLIASKVARQHLAKQDVRAASLQLDSDVVTRLTAATDGVKAHLGTNLDFLFDGEEIRYR